MPEENKNYFTEMYQIDVKDKKEKKNGLDYLSWAWAWAEIKKRHPDANYKVYEREDGRIYFDDGKTAWVKVGVTCNGIEHIEYLPIMDLRNDSLPIEKITSMHVNKAIQRARTKAIADHGIGLYIYAGEDLPEDLAVEPKKDDEGPKCSSCGKPITDHGQYKASVIINSTVKKYGKPMCFDCAEKEKQATLNKEVK